MIVPTNPSEYWLLFLDTAIPQTAIFFFAKYTFLIGTYHKDFPILEFICKIILEAYDSKWFLLFNLATLLTVVNWLQIFNLVVNKFLIAWYIVSWVLPPIKIITICGKLCFLWFNY